MCIFIFNFVFFDFQIESNEIFATIDHSNGMVSFHVNPEKYNGPLMADHIDEEVGHVYLCIVVTAMVSFSSCPDEEMYRN